MIRGRPFARTLPYDSTSTTSRKLSPARRRGRKPRRKNMTGTTERPPQVPLMRDEPERDAMSGWTGWIFFGGIMLIMLGVLHAIQGVVALFNDGYYLVRSTGLVVQVDYAAWGWTHLILGVIAIIAGAGLFTGNTAARVV